MVTGAVSESFGPLLGHEQTKEGTDARRPERRRPDPRRGLSGPAASPPREGLEAHPEREFIEELKRETDEHGSVAGRLWVWGSVLDSRLP
jgi:hypothetical protein